MTRKACDLEAKLKLATAELKESNEIRRQLLQEQEDSESEMIAILGQNQTLKKHLAELHTKYEELLEQKERLQSSLQSVDHCHEAYEEALQRNKDLHQELSECRLKMDNLELKLVPSANNFSSLDLQTELQNSMSNFSVLDLTTPNCKNKSVMKGSNRIKKYVKLNNFIKKSEKKLKIHRKVFDNAKLCKEKCNLKEELNSCYNLIGRNSLELDDLSEKIVDLEKSLHDMTCKYKKAEKEVLDNLEKIDNIVDVVNNDTIYVQVCNNSSQTDPLICENLPLDITPPSVPTLSCAPVAQHVQIHDTQCPVRQPAHCRQTRRTVIYSDGIGMGMGLLLGNKLNQNVINNCFPNTPLDQFTKCIKSDTSLDKNTTLVLHLGDSSNIKRLDLINLLEILLEKVNQGLSKLIVCAFPYAKSLSECENQRIFKINLLIYNLTCRHSDVLYFDTNNFISDFSLSRGTMYLSSSSKLMIAKLLAYNIFDSVISSITYLTDVPVLSSITNRVNHVEVTVGQHLN